MLTSILACSLGFHAIALERSIFMKFFSTLDMPWTCLYARQVYYRQRINTNKRHYLHKNVYFHLENLLNELRTIKAVFSHKLFIKTREK